MLCGCVTTAHGRAKLFCQTNNVKNKPGRRDALDLCESPLILQQLCLQMCSFQTQQSIVPLTSRRRVSSYPRRWPTSDPQKSNRQSNSLRPSYAWSSDRLALLELKQFSPSRLAISRLPEPPPAPCRAPTVAAAPQKASHVLPLQRSFAIPRLR